MLSPILLRPASPTLRKQKTSNTASSPSQLLSGTLAQSQSPLTTPQGSNRYKKTTILDSPNSKSLITADEFNKNFNAVVDKACQEIEAELRKLCPEGGKISNLDLAQVTLAMNNKLRRTENVAAYEIHTSQRLETGQNLVLHNHKLRDSQIAARRHTTQSQITHPSPKPGDTITSLS